MNIFFRKGKTTLVANKLFLAAAFFANKKTPVRGGAVL
jgi:hypothetical protein